VGDFDWRRRLEDLSASWRRVDWRSFWRRWGVWVGLGGVVLVLAVARGLDRGPEQRPIDRVRLGPEPRVTVELDGGSRTLPMDEYVAGVVAGEMDNTWPVDALAAQAIVARTFALREIQDTGGIISADFATAQAYKPDQINDRVREAVRKSRGEVITYRGELIRAFFHSCAGGRTATAQEGLGFRKEETPYLQVVTDDADCTGRFGQRKNWQATFESQAVRRAVRQVTGRDPGPVRSFRIAGRGPSGRATVFAVNGVQVPAPAFRLAIGSETMRSTLIDRIEVVGGRVRLAGRGFGHGVGMAQFGALARVQQGWSPERVIRYYFRDVAIEKRWE